MFILTVLLLYFCYDLSELNGDLTIYNNNNTFDSFDEMILFYNIGKHSDWK